MLRVFLTFIIMFFLFNQSYAQNNKEITELKKQLTENKQKLNDVLKQLKELNNHIKSQEKTITEQKTEIETLKKSKQTEKDKKISMLEQSVKDINEENKTLKDKLTQSDKDKTKIVTEKIEQMQKIQNIITDLKSKNKELEDKLNNKDKELNSETRSSSIANKNILETASKAFEAKNYDTAQGLYLYSLTWQGKEPERDLADIYYKLAVISHNNKDYSKSIDYLKSTIQNSKAKDRYFNLNVYNLMGKNNVSLKQYKEAIDYYKKGIALEAKNKEAVAGLIESYYKEKQFQEIDKLSKSTVEIIKTDFKLNYIIAQSYLALKQPDKAIEYYEAALKLKPDHCSSAFNKGKILFEQKKYDKAVNDLKTAYNLKHEDPIVAGYYGKALYETKSYDEALKVIEKLKQRDPYLNEILIDLYYDKKKYAKAIANLEIIHIQNRKNQNYLIKLGDAYFQLEKYLEASFYYNKAYKLDPKNVKSISKMAKAYFKDKNFIKSSESYLELIKKDSSNAMDFQHLGESYLALGKYKKAKLVFKHLLLKFKDFKDKKKIDAYLDLIKKKES